MEAEKPGLMWTEGWGDMDAERQQRAGGPDLEKVRKKAWDVLGRVNGRAAFISQLYKPAKWVSAEIRAIRPVKETDLAEEQCEV